VFLAVCLLPGSLVLATFEQWWLLLGLSAAVMLGFVALDWWHRPITRGQQPLPEHVLEFCSECVLEIGEDSLIRRSWSLIEGVTRTNKHLLLTIRNTDWAARR